MTPAIAVRAATAADEGVVLALLEELFAPPGRRPADYSRERAAAGFRHAVARADAAVLLAVRDGAVVGLASVYVEFPSMRFGWRCWVEDLVVTAACRGQGVGRRLLDAAAAFGRTRGCVALGLESAVEREAAHRFYDAYGMRRSFAFGREIAPR